MKALITGASSGLGEEFARQLAAKGYDLILSARSTDKLNSLAKELSEKHGIKASSYTIDLSNMAGIRKICDEVIEKEDIDLLINDAGKGIFEGILESSFDNMESMLILNMGTILFMSQTMIKKWIRGNQKGKIINVCSISSFLFNGAFPVYAGTKAFGRAISAGFEFELEEKYPDIKIQCLCPGFAKTHFMGDRYTMEQLEKMGFMEPDIIVKESIDALDTGEFLVIPGEKNKEAVEYLERTPMNEQRKKYRKLIDDTGLRF